MNVPSAAVENDRCPLCSATTRVEDSVPEPNLYSEKLALLLGQDEKRVLEDHANWRCTNCHLVFKPRWFPDDVVRQLFTGAVGKHPKGWDAVLGRFSPSSFRAILRDWERAVEHSVAPEIRRGQRELVSILDSIVDPVGLDVDEVTAAILHDDVSAVRSVSAAIAAAIGEPAPFKRFSGFRSAALWEYLQARTGGFASYAEVGCPLWGLLSIAVQSGCEATYLRRKEVNYWGSGCLNMDEHCSARLLWDQRIHSSSWSANVRYPIVGVFQYLDHPAEPLVFLSQLFGISDSAAIILDGMDAPVAIQHVTGWTDASIDFAAGVFGKKVHADFDDIRPSGNRLYLVTGNV